MTSDDIRVDPELLEDGEHVLWAIGDLTPKKQWKYAVWGGVLFALCFGIYQVYAGVQVWEFLKGEWQDPKILWVLVLGLGVSIIVWVANIWDKHKGISPEQQSEYYVGMITNQRLVLFSADRAPDIVVSRGDVSKVQYDYSNGARALKLDLTASAQLPSVTIVTSGNLDKAKTLIENRFMSSHKYQNINAGTA